MTWNYSPHVFESRVKDYRVKTVITEILPIIYLLLNWLRDSKDRITYRGYLEDIE